MAHRERLTISAPPVGRGEGGLGSVGYPVWVLAESVGGVWRGEVQVDHAAIRFEASLVESR